MTMPWISQNMKNDVVAQICDRIWMAIVQRSLRPGARLKEEELAEVFQVSRARIRQALAVLEKDGLVTLIPNRGACISEPSIDEARDAFFARAQIETRLVERLCHTARAEDVTALTRHIEAERHAHHQRDTEAIVRLSGEFHALIARLSGAGLLAEILHMLTARTSLITAMYQSEQVQNCGPDEHQQIVAAIARRDAPAAIAAMAHHLHHLESALELDKARAPAGDLRAALLSRS
jgi:DNA-binding GntR family transcriptional regulator